MKTKKIRNLFIRGALVCLVIGTLGVADWTFASAKTKCMKKTCDIVVGGIRCLPESVIVPGKVKVSISDKSRVKRVKTPESNMQRANPYSDLDYSGVFVKGKAAGKAKVTIRRKGLKVIFTLNVHDRDSVAANAQAAFEGVLAGLGMSREDPGVVFADIQGDGIDEMIAAGVIYGYDYAKNKVRKVSSELEKEQVSLVRPSSNGVVYFQTTDFPATGSATSVSVTGAAASASVMETAAKDPYKVKTVGRFLVFDLGEIFTELGRVSIYQYRYPKYFVEKPEKGQPYFCLNDSSYDQDDLWNEPYTLPEIEKKIDYVLGVE